MRKTNTRCVESVWRYHQIINISLLIPTKQLLRTIVHIYVDIDNDDNVKQEYSGRKLLQTRLRLWEVYQCQQHDSDHQLRIVSLHQQCFKCLKISYLCIMMDAWWSVSFLEF